ncbi:MAG: hypothetical protein ACK4TA_04275 [Saprospiraceae bacterium]
MSRRILSIGLILLVSWQTLVKLGVFMWFLGNQSYIATTLCINRDKPEMQCNGKCVLMQRLKAVEEERREAQERPLRIIEKLELSHFIVEACSLSDFPSFYTPVETIVQSESTTYNAYLLGILQPPEMT